MPVSGVVLPSGDSGIQAPTCDAMVSQGGGTLALDVGVRSETNHL